MLSRLTDLYPPLIVNVVCERLLKQMSLILCSFWQVDNHFSRSLTSGFSLSSVLSKTRKEIYKKGILCQNNFWHMYCKNIFWWLRNVLELTHCNCWMGTDLLRIIWPHYSDLLLTKNVMYFMQDEELRPSFFKPRSTVFAV